MIDQGLIVPLVHPITTAIISVLTGRPVRRVADVAGDYGHVTADPLGGIAADARLDVAVLLLRETPGAVPLRLCEKPVDVRPGTYLPVNIIQHPLGRAKTIAIRNNLATRSEGDELRYFTDTEEGFRQHREWEHKLKLIEAGKLTREEFMQGINDLVKNVVGVIKNGEIHFIANTTEGKQSIEESRSIRASAIQGKICYFTTIAGALAAAAAMDHLDRLDVNRLQGLHASIQ